MNLQAVGGYYGLGLNRNVHGGIHLCPDEKKRTAVRCTAAGYVVAARLPAKDTDADSKDLKSLIRNHTGLVLVRHEFKEETASESGFEVHDVIDHISAGRQQNGDQNQKGKVGEVQPQGNLICLKIGLKNKKIEEILRKGHYRQVGKTD
jgi:hypothetical protein